MSLDGNEMECAEAQYHAALDFCYTRQDGYHPFLQLNTSYSHHEQSSAERSHGSGYNEGRNTFHTNVPITGAYYAAICVLVVRVVSSPKRA